MMLIKTRILEAIKTALETVMILLYNTWADSNLGPFPGDPGETGHSPFPGDSLAWGQAEDSLRQLKTMVSLR